MATARKWLLVASEDRELARIADRERWMMIVSGPGAAAVERALQRRVDVEGLISTGFCGALDPQLRVGDIVDWSQEPGVRPQIVSSDRVIVTAQEKRKLRERTGARAVDMESEAIAKKAAEWGVPFRAIRAVSDTAEEDMPLDFNLYRDAHGKFSRARIALAALGRPFTAVPALLRLDRNCKLAAERLGEYFADCRL